MIKIISIFRISKLLKDYQPAPRFVVPFVIQLVNIVLSRSKNRNLLIKELLKFLTFIPETQESFAAEATEYSLLGTPYS